MKQQCFPLSTSTPRDLCLHPQLFLSSSTRTPRLVLTTFPLRTTSWLALVTSPPYLAGASRRQSDCH